MGSLESAGVRVVVAFLHVLGVAAGSVVLLWLAPPDGIVWLPVSALAMALTAAAVSWRPFMWLVVGWSALLAFAFAVLLVSLAGQDSPLGVLLLLVFASACFLAGGLLELTLLLRHQADRPLIP